jgi:hypothetical protein
MARLGSVVGAILADIARARVVGDELTRDLVDAYRSDPILGSMSVPRLIIDQAELTLHFTTLDVEEPPPTPPPDTPLIRDAWITHAEDTVVPRIAERLGLPPDIFKGAAADALKPTTADGPANKVFDRAVAGDPSAAATATAKALADVFPNLSPDDQKRLRNKTAIKTAVQDELEAELRTFISKQVDLTSVRAVLASRIDVDIRAPALASQPSAIQELRLTLRAADIDTVIRAAEPGGG